MIENSIRMGQIATLIPRLHRNLRNLGLDLVRDFGRVENAVHRVFVTLKVFALGGQHQVDPLNLSQILAIREPLEAAMTVGVFRIGFTK